jgi:hypothetical protein
MTATDPPSDRPGTVQQAVVLLRARPRESAGAGLLLLAACLSVAAVANDSGAVPVRPEAGAAAAAPPVQEMTPFAVRQIAPSDAQKLNAACRSPAAPTRPPPRSSSRPTARPTPARSSA